MKLQTGSLRGTYRSARESERRSDNLPPRCAAEDGTEVHLRSRSYLDRRNRASPNEQTLNHEVTGSTAVEKTGKAFRLLQQRRRTLASLDVNLACLTFYSAYNRSRMMPTGPPSAKLSTLSVSHSSAREPWSCRIMKSQGISSESRIQLVSPSDSLNERGAE
jgi:hypothetical protein